MGKKYWPFIVDGTGLHTFHNKYCEHCLKREDKDKETGEVIKAVHVHHVLEAKLVVGDRVLSITNEFIEMTNHYLLVQITDILVQHYKNRLKILKNVKKTEKEKSSSLYKCFVDTS